eukprot:m.64955 g.64955  ORF g.64955 m.64955 type:complete len:232 (+) comp15901_c0_seq1:223-918(+)
MATSSVCVAPSIALREKISFLRNGSWIEMDSMMYANGLLLMAENGDFDSKKVLQLHIQPLWTVISGASAQPPKPCENTNLSVIELHEKRKKHFIAVPKATYSDWIAAVTKMPPKDTKEPIYKNTGCTLYRDRLVVHVWYFPLATSKTIPLAAIRKAYAPNVQFLAHKQWGMGVDFDVWWALDMSFSPTGKRVIVDTGTWPKIGFSPIRGSAGAADFLRVLHTALNESRGRS